MKINNINEAREAVAELGDFLERFNRTLGTLGTLTGNSSGQAEMGFASRGVAMSPPRPILRPPPATMPERIVHLLNGSTKPMTPKEMVAAYMAHAWPQPPNGKLYSTLLSCAYYMQKRGKLLNNNGRYSIPVEAAKA